MHIEFPIINNSDLGCADHLLRLKDLESEPLRTRCLALLDSYAITFSGWRVGLAWRCVKKLKETEDPVYKVYLVPGGRFLLDLTKTGAIVYGDLDADDFTWCELMHSSPTGLQHCTVSFEHIVDTSILTLRIAISIERLVPSFASSSDDEWWGGEYAGCCSSSIQEVSIWRVYAQLDGKGIVSGLQANRLSYFRHSQKGG